MNSASVPFPYLRELALCFPRPARLICLQMCVSKTEQRSGLPGPLTAIQEVGDHVIELDSKTGLDVAKHGRRERRTGSRQSRLEPFERRRARWIAALDRDRHALIE